MDKVQQARLILKDLGLPASQQNEISALTLLALCGVGPKDSWRSAKREARTVTKGVMSFMQERYGKTYAPNTRETVRRQVLHQFVQARIVDYNPFELDLPTNSPRAHYAIAQDALMAIRKFDTPAWAGAAKRFVKKYNALAVLYGRHREQPFVPVCLPSGQMLDLSPGQHNEVQQAVIEQFAPRFAPGARLLYLGDTANKDLFLDAHGLSVLGVPLTDHDKLPDVVLYDKRRRWLFLVEVVTSHGPMSPKRVFELEKMLEGSPAGCVFVSAFPDMAEFRRHTREIAWETEVWIAELPDHMIHYNGDKFFGPRKR